MNNKEKNKESGENLHEALESHLWVENLLRQPSDDKKEKKRKRKRE